MKSPAEDLMDRIDNEVYALTTSLMKTEDAQFIKTILRTVNNEGINKIVYTNPLPDYRHTCPLTEGGAKILQMSGTTLYGRDLPWDSNVIALQIDGNTIRIPPGNYQLSYNYTTTINTQRYKPTERKYFRKSILWLYLAQAFKRTGLLVHTRCL